MVSKLSYTKKNNIDRPFVYFILRQRTYVGRIARQAQALFILNPIRIPTHFAFGKVTALIWAHTASYNTSRAERLSAYRCGWLNDTLVCANAEHPYRFNFLGQVAVTTGITFGCAGLISTLATVQSDYKPTAAKTIGIYAALLVSHGTINTFGVRLLRYLNNSSVVLHSVGVTCFAIALLAKAPTHQSAKFVFASFYDGTGDPGWSVRASPAYVAVCGVLMSQYTITGETAHF